MAVYCWFHVTDRAQGVPYARGLGCSDINFESDDSAWVDETAPSMVYNGYTIMDTHTGYISEVA